jgi:hypothetical protein
MYLNPGPENTETCVSKEKVTSPVKAGIMNYPEMMKIIAPDHYLCNNRHNKKQKSYPA